MQSEFSRVLQKQADFFSFDPSSDKITRVRDEVTQRPRGVLLCRRPQLLTCGAPLKVNKTKQVMVDNIDKVLQRGEKIELLVQYVCERAVL